MTKQEKIKQAQGDLRHAQIKHGLSMERAARLAEAQADVARAEAAAGLSRIADTYGELQAAERRLAAAMEE